MKFTCCGILLFSLWLNIFAQEAPEFDTYFLGKTLRFDYYHSGNSENESITSDREREEPYWAGSKKNLIDPFRYGKYMVMIYDSASGKLIYSKGYSTLFSEWQTTDEAKHIDRTFSETVTFPFPKATVRLEILSRNKKGEFISKFSRFIDPADYFIEGVSNSRYQVKSILKSGEPGNKVDIVIIPDGYTKEQMGKFIDDCKKFAGYLFKASPFRENKDKFNITAVEAYSEESGTDIPAEHIWKNTVVNSSFYTFNEDRYLMTNDNKTLRDIASYAPYDQIYILVNTGKYGGGSIYNHYSVCVSDNKYEEYIFTHEFGHGFAGLGDEYYTSSVAYVDFYPHDVEPWEANLTTLVDFSKKWKSMLKADTPVPTPPGSKYPVGVYEGGGYSEKGVYRAAEDCTMKSISMDNFCPVCRKAITDMINYYTE